MSDDVEALRAVVRALRSALEALQAESSDRYQKLVKHSGLGIFLADSEGRYLAANPAGCAMVGYTEEELKQLRMIDLLPPPDKIPFETQRMKDLKARGRKDVRRQLLTKDGRVIDVEVYASILPDGSIEGVVRDVSARIEAEREREQLENALRQAQKMESVGRLSGGIAHDFNNILAVILGNASLLADEVTGQEQREGVTEILEACGRAGTLVNQLLAFSRKQILRPSVLDISDVLRPMVTMIGRVLGEHIAVRLDLDHGGVHVLADQNQLEQVFLNLAVNARDAMPEGGTLTVRTRARGGKLVIEVEDTGVGMSETVCQHIFEPFFTTKEAGHGTGLGLSTSFGIVVQSGGSIRVESEEGRGSRFTIELPVTAVRPRAGATVAEQEAAPSAGQGRVLIVEDNPQFNSTCARILERAGYETTCVATGEQARALFEAGGAFDLVVSDVVMPGMNGTDLARWLVSERPEIKVMLVSGYAQPILEDGSTPPSSVAFLSKPFTVAALLAEVGRLLA